MKDTVGALSIYDEMPDYPNLTHAQAKAHPAPHGNGVTLDGMTEFFPGINCIECAKFVGRDGVMEITYFEMSNEIASIEGTCGRCLIPTTGHES